MTEHDKAEITRELSEIILDVMPDAAICRGNSTELNAYNGISYLWSPDSTLNNNNIPNPTASPYYTATYDVCRQFLAHREFTDFQQSMIIKAALQMQKVQEVLKEREAAKG